MSKKAKAPKIELQEGDVFAPARDNARHTHRRIIGLISNKVVYLVGGDGRNMACSEKAFLRWVGEKMSGSQGFTYSGGAQAGK
ncbi:MAG: hypothetical protein GAK35_02624 [Herbaspirillum frisingense]|uniref:Uncharacterized protein n=1 Tax=Herbaspirillum frisingense TaxID=92645 RepID=A0A7V8FVR2_9BURK|nr:MAG: hypothetical protein GAK35_02624 [Herbaspirillum frisingense]